MKYILVFVVVIMASCLSQKKYTISDKNSLDDLVLDAVFSGSKYFNPTDTIYLYDHFSFNTNHNSNYYRSYNASMQLTFVDTFQVKQTKFERNVDWNTFGRYCELFDSTRMVNKELLRKSQMNYVFVSDNNLDYYKYTLKKTIYYPEFVLPRDKKNSITLRYNGQILEKIIHFNFEYINDKFTLINETRTYLESHTYTIADWHKEINFDQTLESYLENDYMDMVRLFDSNWEKECMKITGEPCLKIKLVDKLSK